jgi:polysaccharide biosynthesis/export protein
MQHLRQGLYAVAFVLSAAVAANAQQAPGTIPNATGTIPNAPVNATPAPPQNAQPQKPPVPGLILPGGVIEPGDQLNVQVFGDQSLTQTVTVAADGTIAYPLIGRVKVGGETAEQASSTITTKLQQYVKHPSVTVAIAQAGEEGVLVLGNVKTPGKYAIRSGGHLTDALAAAGGLGNTNGDLPQVRITQNDGTNKEISLQQLLHDGNSKLNVPIQNNSIVYVVAPNAITVNVVGAVDHPGAVQIDEGDRLSMAIARAGTSANAISDLNHVVITRTDASGKTSKQEINMYNALKDGDKRYDPVLAKGDVVYVPMGKRPGGNGTFNPLDLVTRLIGL